MDADFSAVDVAVRHLLERDVGGRSGCAVAGGRIVYFVGYLSAAEKRFPGFFIQSLATFVLLLGALGRVIYLAAI